MEKQIGSAQNSGLPEVQMARSLYTDDCRLIQDVVLCFRGSQRPSEGPVCVFAYKLSHPDILASLAASQGSYGLWGDMGDDELPW